ncbi:glycosyltransferase family 2 protein [Ensifer sp. SL37]|uniref:glycosyltransferase family 2 protein n=1 Tax=Ensifer sp. SL37 TaxID=2995137 RepID=UPI002275AA48|nr:glycosyltransferase family 2 protein [Ensifer sp. SL37]MCY1740373.1 glycosyltransferase family 2 protein [Ensifer sp. SL37]
MDYFNGARSDTPGLRLAQSEKQLPSRSDICDLEPGNESWSKAAKTREERMLNIVIPMAGHGSRFAQAGFALPKPLIPVHGVPMIRVVIANLAPTKPHRFIFICQKAHLENYALGESLATWAPGCSVIPVDQVTEGAACSVLLARELVDNNDPLMIANCDQYVDVDINRYLGASERYDGYIMTMKAHDPKWSFVGFDENGRVAKVVEKEVISDEATVGIYNFSRGSSFVQAADRMIRKDFRVNGEFYVAPVYDELISQGGEVGVYSIGTLNQGMYGLGVPDDLEAFLKLELSRKATKGLLDANN